MARASIPVATMIRTAAVPYNPVVGDPVNGHFLNTPGECVLYVHNPTGGPLDVSFQFARTFDGNAVQPKVVSVPAGFRVYFGRWNPALYYQEQDQGRLYVDVSSASLTLGAFRMPKLR